MTGERPTQIEGPEIQLTPVRGWRMFDVELRRCRIPSPLRTRCAEWRAQTQVPIHMTLVGQTGYRWAAARLTARCWGRATPLLSGDAETEQAASHLRAGACRCGIYVHRHPAELLRSLYPGVWPIVLAETVGWGYVVEHLYGWRCQHVQLRSLVLIYPEGPDGPTNYDELLAYGLEYVYNVPVAVIRATFERYPRIEDVLNAARVPPWQL